MLTQVISPGSDRGIGDHRSVVLLLLDAGGSAPAWTAVQHPVGGDQR